MDLNSGKLLAAKEKTSIGTRLHYIPREVWGCSLHFIAAPQRFSKMVCSGLPGSMRFVSVRASQDVVQPIMHNNVMVLGWVVILTWHLALSRKVTSIQKS